VSDLSGRRRDFVRYIVEGRSPKAAAMGAGYAPTYACQTAHRLLNKDPAVSEAIERAKAQKAETLAQLDQCRKVAIERGDAGAAIRAVELLTQMRTDAP
jgi:phage terminase small subunit